jgi:hypothetical protein
LNPHWNKEGKVWLPLFLSRLAEPGDDNGKGRGTNMVGLVGERERREGITRDVASGDLSSEALEGSVT